MLTESGVEIGNGASAQEGMDEYVMQNQAVVQDVKRYRGDIGRGHIIAAALFWRGWIWP